MINVNRIGLDNVVYFKEAHFDLVPGLRVFRGLNKQSSTKHQNNGAGKSLLFSPLANVFVGSPPVITKKKSRKDILGEKSCVSIDFETHDKKNVVVKQYSGKYEIWEDGKDLEIAVPTKAEKQIREYFPLNEQEFYSTCYMTSLIPLNFQVYSASERLKYISDLFRLHDYDALRKHFSISLRKIKDSETEYRTLVVELEKCTSLLQKVEWGKEKQEQLVELQAKVNAVQGQLRTTQDQLLKYSKMAIVHSQLTTLQAKVKNKDKVKLTKQLKQLKSILSDCEAYDDYVKEYSAYKNSVSNIQAKYDAINVEGSLSKVEISLRDVSEQLAEMEQEVKKFKKAKTANDEYLEQVEEYKERLSMYKFKIKKADVSEEIATVKSLLKLEALLEEHEHGDTLQCPTCNTNLDYKNLKRIVNTAKDDYLRLKKMHEAQQLQREYDELKKPEYDKLEHLKFLELVEKKQEKEQLLAFQFKALQRKQEYKDALASITKPKKVVDPEYDTADIAAKIANNTTLLEYHAQIEELLQQHDYDDNFDLNKEAELQKEYDRLSKTLTELHDQVNTLDNRRSEYKLLYANKLDVDSKIAELRESINNKRVVESLMAAYGPKGLKLKVMGNILRTLEESFNNYAPYIFNENFSFELSVDSSGINATVHRPRGFNSDIRMMSGAESNSFRMLFLTSMLPLMPPDRRTNFLILDEPMSNGDPLTKEKFIHDFVPHLCSVVPSVNILTPDDDVYPNAHNMLVVKEKGVSRLIEDPYRN